MSSLATLPRPASSSNQGHQLPSSSSSPRSFQTSFSFSTTQSSLYPPNLNFPNASNARETIHVTDLAPVPRELFNALATTVANTLIVTGATAEQNELAKNHDAGWQRRMEMGLGLHVALMLYVRLVLLSAVRTVKWKGVIIVDVLAKGNLLDGYFWERRE